MYVRSHHITSSYLDLFAVFIGKRRTVTMLLFNDLLLNVDSFPQKNFFFVLDFFKFHPDFLGDPEVFRETPKYFGRPRQADK